MKRMKERLLSILICSVVLIASLPMTTFAAHTQTVTSVSITGLDFPVQGKVLDTTYSIPENGVYYIKDTAFAEVTWYDQGTTMGQVGSGEALSAGATAQYGHYYMAEMHFCDTSWTDNTKEGAFPQKQWFITII